jgi:dihydrofolate synthase/folylpolyglutamate synthase
MSSLREFTDLDEAFLYIEEFTNLERGVPEELREYRLDRMKVLRHVFGDPDRGINIIHIAGSKGKGSTGIFLARLLEAAGHNTGLYASPHVSTYRERISRAGDFFPDSLYLSQINLIHRTIDNLPKGTLPYQSRPTSFELLTILAFLIFKESGCGWGVIETGLGGRLDATNIFSPEAVVLTPVELEHTDILGSTLEAIAGEKAGIIKPGIPVFSGFQKREVEQVFIDICHLQKAPLTLLRKEVDIDIGSACAAGREVTFQFADGCSNKTRLSMPGVVQPENAALALTVLRGLSSKYGLLPDDEQITETLSRAALPGRMEIISTRWGDFTGTIVFDGAHTSSSIKKLLETFREIYPVGGSLIFGSVEGKDVVGMAKILARSFEKIVISRPGTFKKSDPGRVYAEFFKRNPGTMLQIEPDKALKEAFKGCHGPILVTGSFFMVSEIRKLLPEVHNDGQFTKP